jgi:hypothetical protein
LGNKKNNGIAEDEPSSKICSWLLKEYCVGGLQRTEVILSSFTRLQILMTTPNAEYSGQPETQQQQNGRFGYG